MSIPISRFRAVLKNLRTPPTPGRNPLGHSPGGLFFAREANKGHSSTTFPGALTINKIKQYAFLASCSALALAGIVITAKKLISSDDAEEKVDEFMKSYGNRIFLEGMTYDIFRNSVNELRHAEALHHGIHFEKNEQSAIFYRGMAFPGHLDEKNPEHIKQWQEGTITSFLSRGFSPLIWLTRPSGTKSSGFNLQPFDGSVAREHGQDEVRPASWSAAVVAMSCSFDKAMDYTQQTTLDNGCIILAAPEEIFYLSATDIESRHTPHIQHEHEVITPYIDKKRILGILFVINKKIIGVEINEQISDYKIDVDLVKTLRDAYSKASPEAQPKLKYLIDKLDGQKNDRVNLIEEFYKRFNQTPQALVDATRSYIAKCDAEIDKMPGPLGSILRSSRVEHGVRTPEQVAEELGIPYEPTPKAPMTPRI